MTEIVISEKEINKENLLYIQQSLSELTYQTNTRFYLLNLNGREIMTYNCEDNYSDIIKAEIADKIAEIIAVKYKYDYYKNAIKTTLLNETEYEILLASLIAADLDDDKRYAYERVKNFSSLAIDGIYNFRLSALKKKWIDVASYIPQGFMKNQLNDFVGYLIENKKDRCFVDCGRVYDCHYRRLKRASLLNGEKAKIIREILLSNSGEIEINGKIPKEDEYYMKEFYKDKIYFSTLYSS